MNNISPTLAQSPIAIDPDTMATEFLRRVLPAGGLYAAAIKGTKGAFRNSFHPTIESLWQTLREADRSGCEVYYTVASLRSNANREADNVAALKSFRLDIDFGEGHKGDVYASKIEALEAVKKFYVEARLPPPMVVESGGGAHCYWPLADELTRERWLPFALGLKAACINLGLKADHVITGDVARILRPPCTTNRKLPGKLRPVTIDPRFLQIEAYELSRFETLLKYEMPAPCVAWTPSAMVPPFAREPLPEFLKSRRSKNLAETLLKSFGDFNPADAEMIATQCAQLRAMRDSGGVMPEPAWKACIGVLAFCENGEALAHEWSKGDARYDPMETQRKFDACRKLTGATRCEHFFGLDDQARARCEGCPHKQKISSPILLGAQALLLSANAEKGPAPKPIHWELTEKGVRRPKSYPNTVLAIDALGMECRHDIFHDKKLVTGDLSESLGPVLSDEIARAVRDAIIANFGFDPGKDNVHEALERACERVRFDPVADYLNSLQWDGQPRLDRWLTIYLGAEDTPLNRAFGRNALIAGVRRVFQPGCKFDSMLILEGPQGAGKSLAARALAGSDENFSDQPMCLHDAKQQQESVKGVWIYEMGELVGLRKADVENIKNFLSRTADNVRPAYGRHRVDRPRRCIFIGTTNAGKHDGYLNDPSGGRRFWPVEVGAIDLEALRRDRDQLWAEAVKAENAEESLSIDKSLYAAAAIQQEMRRSPDGWMDILANVRGTIVETAEGPMERIPSIELLTHHLQMQAAQITDASTKRLGHVMRRLGWTGPTTMRLPSKGSTQAKGTPAVKGYWRKAEAM